MTPDELLTHTRAVRKRLDLTRPVPRELILECIRIAQQAPTGSDRQGWRWVVVTDPDVKAGLADIYRRGAATYLATSGDVPDGVLDGTAARIKASSEHLEAHLHEVPALVVPCIKGRVDAGPHAPAPALLASHYGSIFPAVWSYMLAARNRGLGTSLTTVHLFHEREAAELLGIPADVTQVGLIPTAYFVGETFRQAERPPAEWITSWDRWGNKS